MKSIKTAQDARKSIKIGIDKLNDLVKATIGPKGRNVIISKNYGKPVITNDGVTIAKQVQLEDQFEDLGARICRQVAQKTNEQAGDGTTTATILAQAIIQEGNQHILRGTNAISLQRALQKYGKQVVQILKQYGLEISNEKEIANIATISSNNDTEIGNIISMAIKQSGIDGVINIEDSKTMDTWLQRVEGMQINSGFVSPYFVNDPVKMEVSLEDAYILVFNGKIFAVQDIIQILKQIANKGASLLILAQDIQGQALATLVVNKAKNILNVCAVKLTGMGEGRKNVAQDICAATGAKYLAKEIGTKLTEVKLDDLGRAKKIIVGQHSTVIRQGAGIKQEIQNRVASIKFKADNSDNVMEIQRLQKRIARLIEGVSVIHVGAQTEMQLREKKYRMEDALNATKAAIQQGIVPGGGSTLVKCSKRLKEIEVSSEEEKIAKQILVKALLYPLKQIALNSGQEESRVIEILNSMKQSQDVNYGYNALTGQLQDLFKAGIIDPLKVVRCALQNAISISGLFLTTEGIILQHKTKESEQQNSMFNGV